MAQTQWLQSVPYCGPVPAPETLWVSWNSDPVLLAGLAVFMGWGWLRARQRPAFMVAWVLLAVAFVSPLCALTTVSLAARSLHHLVLVLMVAPLLAVAMPWRGLSVTLSAPLSAGMVMLVMAGWHVPLVYTAAWQSHGIYWLMQGIGLGGAWALWSHILRPRHSDPAHLAVQAMALMGLAGVMGLVGAILTFAPRALFDEHLAGAMAWGFAPLADQQLAGLVMWGPGMIPLAVIAGLMLGRVWRAGQPA